MKIYRAILVMILSALMLTTTLAQSQDACALAKESVTATLVEVESALADDRTADAGELLRDARALLIQDCSGAASQLLRGSSALGESATITAPDVNQNGNIAYIRVVNLSADTPELSVTGFDGQFVVDGLAFGQFTPLIPIQAGNHTFTSNTNLSNVTWDFSSNSTWVLAATGLRSTSSTALQPIATLRNDLKGQARVRIIHALPNLGRIDIESEDGTVFGENLGWLGNRDTMVDAGDYTLRVATPAGGSVIAPTLFTFESNQSYVIFVSGSAEDAVFVETVSPYDMTRVRFINDTSEDLDIHYRPGNQKIVEVLVAGATSDWVELPSSAVTFVAYQPHTGPTGQERASFPVTLRTGRDMTISIANGQMSVEEIAFTQ